MRKIFFLMVMLTAFSFITASAQLFPGFLQGTWKLENKESYEHWDLITGDSLKGFSYQVKDGKMIVNEYLDINRKENEIVYTATVLNQNRGVGIDFILVKSNGIYSFENPNHDFPKFIRYQPISENSMKVTLGTTENSFTLNFQKIE